MLNNILSAHRTADVSTLSTSKTLDSCVSLTLNSPDSPMTFKHTTRTSKVITSITLSCFILGCGLEGPPGDKGEQGKNWPREDVYCSTSTNPGPLTGNRFYIFTFCDQHDFPLSGSCNSGERGNLRIVGGEYEYWEKTGGLEPLFTCTFEWTTPPPYPSQSSSGASTEICCVRRYPNTNPLGKF